MMFAVRTGLVSPVRFLSYFLALSSQACYCTGSLLIHGKFSMPNERRHWASRASKLARNQTNSWNPSLPPQKQSLSFPNISLTDELEPEDKQPWVELVSLLRPLIVLPPGVSTNTLSSFRSILLLSTLATVPLLQ